MELADQIYVGQVNDLLRMVGVDAAACYGTKSGPGLDTGFGYYVTVTSRRERELLWVCYRLHGQWVLEERHRGKLKGTYELEVAHRDEPTRVAFAILRWLARRLVGQVQSRQEVEELPLRLRLDSLQEVQDGLQSN